MRLDCSYDECGPMSYLGDLFFSAETGLPGGRQIFEVPTFLAASDEAKIIVEYNGVRLSDFGTWNDYYGFGTSPETALEECEGRLRKLEGLNADISLVVTLTRTPCFPSKDNPFYNGAQRIHHIPMTWRVENPLCKETKRDFLVWQNGERMPQALEFFEEVERLAAEDAAPNRNGPLRTVARRKRPTPKEMFLLTQIVETAPSQDAPLEGEIMP